MVSAEDKGKDWCHGRKGKGMDAALSRNLNRLLSQVQMGKAKILPVYPALYYSSFLKLAHLTIIMKGHKKPHEGWHPHL